MTKRRGHTWANWLRKKRTAPINFEFKTHHAAKGRQLKRVYDMVREFHTRDEEEENSLELLFSPSGILSYVLRRKTLYRKFVKKKKEEATGERTGTRKETKIRRRAWEQTRREKRRWNRGLEYIYILVKKYYWKIPSFQPLLFRVRSRTKITVVYLFLF